LFHAFEADTALGELADDHFVERAHLESVLGRKLDLGFFEDDFSLASLEIEAVGQLFFGLVDGVLDFHGIDLGGDVE
jgi:hypothetical protein